MGTEYRITRQSYLPGQSQQVLWITRELPVPEMSLHLMFSVPISISTQWFFFQNLSNLFFNPSKLLVFVTAHTKDLHSWNTGCLTSHLLQFAFKPAISWVHLMSLSSGARRVNSLSLSPFFTSILALEITFMPFVPSSLPTNTAGSTSSCSGPEQELFQTSHLCLWFAASPKVQKMFHQPRHLLNIFMLGRWKCSCFQAFVNCYWGLKRNFCKPSG